MFILFTFWTRIEEVNIINRNKDLTSFLHLFLSPNEKSNQNQNQELSVDSTFNFHLFSILLNKKLMSQVLYCIAFFFRNPNSLAFISVGCTFVRSKSMNESTNKVRTKRRNVSSLQMHQWKNDRGKWHLTQTILISVRMQWRICATLKEAYENYLIQSKSQNRWLQHSSGSNYSDILHFLYFSSIICRSTEVPLFHCALNVFAVCVGVSYTLVLVLRVKMLTKTNERGKQ